MHGCDVSAFERADRLVTQHISGIGDVTMMIEAGKFAGRFGLEYSEDIRMLDDLGWDLDHARESFDLTLPPLS
jgi:hypothetical protein